jgi:hypothetical protein
MHSEKQMFGSILSAMGKSILDGFEDGMMVPLLNVRFGTNGSVGQSRLPPALCRGLLRLFHELLQIHSSYRMV